MSSLCSTSKLRSIYLLLSDLPHYCSTMFSGGLSKILNVKCCTVWNTSWCTIAFVTVHKNVMGTDQLSTPAFVCFPPPSLENFRKSGRQKKVLERLPLDFWYCSAPPFKRDCILKGHLHTSSTSHTYLYLICILITTSQLQLMPYIPQIGRVKQITFISSFVIYFTVICGPKRCNCGHCTRTGHRWFLPPKVM